MPCRCDWFCPRCNKDHDGDCPKQIHISVDGIGTLPLAQKKSPPATTNLLCEACELLSEEGLLDMASSALKKWWQEHEASEVDRVRLEAAQKLTSRERRLLGIDLKTLKSKAK